MKIIDEKGKLFGLINIFDLAILLVIVLVAGTVGYKVLGGRLSGTASNGQSKYYLVTIKCEQASEKAAQALKPGDKIYRDRYGFLDAEIQNISYEDAVMYVETSDGEVVKTLHPELKDIYVDIKIGAPSNSSIIKLGDDQVNIGYEIIIKTDRVYSRGIVEDIVDL